MVKSANEEEGRREVKTSVGGKSETRTYERIKNCPYTCGHRARCIRLDLPCPKLRDEGSKFEVIEVAVLKLYARKKG